MDLDIKQSMHDIKQNLGYDPIAFAYPYGQFNSVTEEVLKSNGMKMTFITKNGFIENSTNTFLINRIAIHGFDDLATFVHKLNDDLSTK